MSLEFLVELDESDKSLSEADIERLRDTVMGEDLLISRQNGAYSVLRVHGEAYSLLCKISSSAIPEAYKGRVEELMARPRNIRLHEMIGLEY
jgi:hypothetical protein